MRIDKERERGVRAYGRVERNISFDIFYLFGRKLSFQPLNGNRYSGNEASEVARGHFSRNRLITHEVLVSRWWMNSLYLQVIFNNCTDFLSHS